MSYFPIFYSVNEKRILLIGAGSVATEKLNKLLEFTTNITIIAATLSESILNLKEQYSLHLINKEYERGDIKGFDMVIVAVDDLSLQEYIYNECKKEKIICNCVDLHRCCDFIFPSYIKEGDLTIAISTNGTSPAFAKRFKSYLKKQIPSDISSFLKQMKELRKTLPKGKERMKLLDEKVREYIKSWN